jgi:hypothetical protein
VGEAAARTARRRPTTRPQENDGSLAEATTDAAAKDGGALADATADAAPEGGCNAAVAGAGPLTVRSNQIVDGHGAPLMLRGGQVPSEFNVNWKGGGSIPSVLNPGVFAAMPTVGRMVGSVRSVRASRSRSRPSLASSACKRRAP